MVLLTTWRVSYPKVNIYYVKMAFTLLTKSYSLVTLSGVGRPSLQDHVFQFSFSYFWNHQLFLIKIHVKFVHSKFNITLSLGRFASLFPRIKEDGGHGLSSSIGKTPSKCFFIRWITSQWQRKFVSRKVEFTSRKI